MRVRPKGDGPLNFRCPLSDVACEVYNNNTREVINLTKFDPDKDWGEFEWDFEVVDKSKAQMYSQAVSYNQSSGDQVGPTSDNYNMNDDNGAGSAGLACPVCTFLNTPGSAICDMCGSDLS